MPAELLALLAAFAFALGSTLQQRGTMQTPAKEGDPRFLLQIFGMPVWLLGAALQGVGWFFKVAALAGGSLVVVQALITLSVVFALPLGARFTDQKVGRRSIIGAGATVAGIVTFLAVGQPGSGTSKPGTPVLLFWGIVVVACMLGLAWLAGRRRGPVASALYATSAGISYGLHSAVTKVFVTQVGGGVAVILTSLSTYLLIVSALAGFAFQQSALKSGFLVPAMAAGNASLLATSVVLGIVLFGERLASGGNLPLALGGLAVAIAGVVLLAQPDRPQVEAAAS